MLHFNKTWKKKKRKFYKKIKEIKESIESIENEKKVIKEKTIEVII